MELKKVLYLTLLFSATVLADDLFLKEKPLKFGFYYPVKELVEMRGFLYEEYQVTTEDNYILTLMHIPGHKDDFLPRPRRPAVLL